MCAYDLPRDRVIGGPAWIDSDQWRVETRAAGPAKRPEMQAMVRTLLADRFALKVHVETRQLPIIPRTIPPPAVSPDFFIPPPDKPTISPIDQRDDDAHELDAARSLRQAAELIQFF
jgi:hypothetical protein